MCRFARRPTAPVRHRTHNGEPSADRLPGKKTCNTCSMPDVRAGSEPARTSSYQPPPCASDGGGCFL
ncbi:hypothetical protein GCM10009564_09300 [Streptomyces thermogriseus]|uniref:Uncharacterized protein n=1 Tax=Streptomyces thermogriseus TaxID=75292 RepID=A0ABN1STW6_9ACTN